MNFQHSLTVLWRLGQIESNLNYNGAAVFISTAGAGARDDPAFFPLYIGQASNLQRRVGQHHDPTYRNITHH